MNALPTLPVAIIGNGGAAAEAVLALRASGFTQDIHLFSSDSFPPYNPMLGPHLISGELSAAQVFPFGDTRAFYDGNAVTAHLEEEVVLVDPSEQTLSTNKGLSYRYQACLVASGARPSVPPVPGLAQVLAERRCAFTLRSLAEALAVRQAVQNLLAPGKHLSPKAAVVGGSLAGVKVAAALHSLGFAVSLVEREAHVLPLTVHPDCARVIEEHLLAEGYRLFLSVTITRVRAGTGPGIEVTLGPPHSRQERFDLLVLCTGCSPRVDFLSPSPVQIDQGILVDEHLRSTVPTLYAAGDVAQGRELISGKRKIVGLWVSARRQGRAAGSNLAGIAVRHQGEIAHSITKVGRLLLASLGQIEEYDEVDTRRHRDYMEVRLYKQGKLIGINLLGRFHHAGILRQALVRRIATQDPRLEVTWPLLTLS